MILLAIECIVLFFLIDTLYNLIDKFKFKKLKFLYEVFLWTYILVTGDVMRVLDSTSDTFVRYYPIILLFGIIIITSLIIICIYRESDSNGTNSE